MMVVAAIAAVGLGVAGCSDSSESSSEGGDPAATIEETKAPDGTELQRITLEPRAAERLGIRFATITEEAGSLVAPYAALVYDPFGSTWVYTSPKPNVFLRAPVNVREIAGERVFLVDGPEAGTKVVTRATIELYGVEEEIGA
jgi:hypothetical protein